MAMTCDRVREVASGFVLGALDLDEMTAVSDHLDSCSKPHPEIDDFGGVLPYLAESLEPLEPPAWLRESVIAAAQADLVARRRAGELPERGVAEPVEVRAAAGAPLAAVAWQGQPSAGDAEIVSLASARASRLRRAMTWATRVAAVVAVVALAGYTVVLQGDISKWQKDHDQNSKILAYIGQPDTRTGVLAAHDGSTAAGLAMLRPSGSIIVTATGLAPTHGDEVYMVWLTGDNGNVSKVGWFNVDDSGQGFLQVDNVPTSASLWIWVCREPNATVTKPTGPTIVSGTISL